MTFLDGDFHIKGRCKYFCNPTCHPAQISPKWVYGCLNPNHPDYDPYDFCPIVNCGGRKAKCEVKGVQSCNAL